MIPANFRFGVGLLVLITTSIACGVTLPSSEPAGSEIETVVAATLKAATDQAPPVGLDGIPISTQNVSFTIPNGLASGAIYEIVPAKTEDEVGPWGVAPEHIEITLTDYPIYDQSFEPVVHVYPAHEYAAVNPWAETSLVRLQAVLASPSAALTNDNLPTSPFNGAAAQLYAAQAKRLTFNGGNGVRMISMYGQFPGYVSSDFSFYHYEGLTSDGKYLVATLFPLILPLQANDENKSADGVIYPENPLDGDVINTYYQGMTDLLNAKSNDSFQPNLEMLDGLVQSISVTP